MPQFAPASDDAPPTALDEASAAFSQAHPGVDVQVAVKPARGDGGIAPFLAMTARVAPSARPDLVVLPLDAFALPGLEGTLVPWEASADSAFDVFTYAAESVGLTADQAPSGLPFAVDIVHAVTRGSEPPGSWGGVADAAPFVLPAPSSDCIALSPLLAFYAASGGEIAALPDASPDALDESLAFVSTSVADGVMVALPNAAESGASQVQSQLEAAATSAAVDAAQYVPVQEAQPDWAWGPLPGPERPAPVIGCGWAFAVTATDPDRAAVARQLAEWLTDRERRSWVVERGALPADRTDWAATVVDAVPAPPEAAYLAYLEAQLQAAVPIFSLDSWGGTFTDAYEQALAGEPSADAISTP